MRALDGVFDTVEVIRAPIHPHAPLNDLSSRALQRLARRADRLHRRDVAGLEALADQLGVRGRQLRLLADAWAEGGRSGVDALGPAPAADDRAMVEESATARAREVIETWRRRHFALDALEVDVWRNRITVHWMRPGADPTAPLERRPLMQLRRTSEGRWHLYRRAAQGEWWPVVVRGRRQRQSLSACLDLVRSDPYHHFWGAERPLDVRLSDD